MLQTQAINAAREQDDKLRQERSLESQAMQNDLFLRAIATVATSGAHYDGAGNKKSQKRGRRTSKKKSKYTEDMTNPYPNPTRVCEGGYV